MSYLKLRLLDPRADPIASLGMCKVDYKGLPLQIMLLGKYMQATFRASINVLKRDTGATLMSKLRAS